MVDERQPFCGIGPVPPDRRRGSAEQCVENGQVRYWGKKKISGDDGGGGDNRSSKTSKRSTKSDDSGPTMEEMTPAQLDRFINKSDAKYTKLNTKRYRKGIEIEINRDKMGAFQEALDTGTKIVQSEGRAYSTKTLPLTDKDREMYKRKVREAKQQDKYLVTDWKELNKASNAVLADYIRGFEYRDGNLIGKREALKRAVEVTQEVRDRVKARAKSVPGYQTFSPHTVRLFPPPPAGAATKHPPSQRPSVTVREDGRINPKRGSKSASKSGSGSKKGSKSASRSSKSGSKSSSKSGSKSGEPLQPLKPKIGFNSDTPGYFRLFAAAPPGAATSAAQKKMGWIKDDKPAPKPEPRSKTGSRSGKSRGGAPHRQMQAH